MEETISNIWETEAKYGWIYKDLLEIIKSHKAIEKKKKLGKWYTQAIQNRKKKTPDNKYMKWFLNLAGKWNTLNGSRTCQ